VYSDELKAEAVQMVLDGHRAESVAENLGLSSVSLLYRWKAKLLRQSGAAAATLENRVRQLEEDLHRVERERDVLKKGSSGNFGTKPLSRQERGKYRCLFSAPGPRREEAPVLPPGCSRKSRMNLKKALAIFSQRM
jgi:transposase